MKKRNLMYAMTGIFLLLLLLGSSTPIAPSLTSITPRKVSSQRVDFAKFQVVAPGSAALSMGTPIILKTTDFQLPYSMLGTAVVMNSAGTAAYPTQCDDLNGDEIVDEIVFLLPDAISAGNSVEFLLTGKTEGMTNNPVTNPNLKVKHVKNYNETYADWLPTWANASFMNGTSLSNMVDEIGEVVWAETDWGILCLTISAGWRQSSWKHIIIKGTTVDIVMADYNATDDWRWQWTKMGFEDPGWHNDEAADTVAIAKAGPIRIVIQTESGIGYRGAYGIADDLKARKTFILYEDIPGIVRNVQIIDEASKEAWAGMTDYYGGPMELSSKFVDHGMNTTCPPNVTCAWKSNINSLGFDMIYSPNDPGLAANNSRWQNNSAIMHFNLSALTESWFAMYNGSTKNGFIVDWGNFDYADKLTSIDWSDGEIDVKYAFENFPLEGINQIFIPIDGSAITSVPGDFKALHNAFTLDYSLTWEYYGLDEIPPMYSTYTNTYNVSYEAATLEVFADTASGKLVAGTPIIIKASEYPLPNSKLSTAVIFDGTTPMLTQADDLDGDGFADEVLFRLPIDIDVGNSDTFTLAVKNAGSKNGFSRDPNLNVLHTTNYSDTYKNWLPTWANASFMNGTKLSDMVDEVGEVVWAETDWGIFCLYISAGWRQSSWKHIILKSANFDMVMAEYNATDDWRWQWTKMGFEDPGWHNDEGPDKVLLAKAGPIRITIVTESGIGYRGAYGIADDVKALKTFTIYNDRIGIHRNLRLAGKDALAASRSMTDYYGGPMELSSKFVDHGMNTTCPPNVTCAWKSNINSLGFDMIYSPNDPGLAANNSRWQNNSAIMHFNLSALTESWFAMYNGSTGKGFILDWGNFDYADKLTSIDWSDGEIDVKYAFENFPMKGLDQILIPIKTTDKTVMANNQTAWMQDYALKFTSLIREPWVSTATETETVTETETETSTEISTEVSVSVSVSTFVTELVTTVTEATPGFELLSLLLVAVVAVPVFIYRRRRR